MSGTARVVRAIAWTTASEAELDARKSIGRGVDPRAAGLPRATTVGADMRAIFGPPRRAGAGGEQLGRRIDPVDPRRPIGRAAIWIALAVLVVVAIALMIRGTRPAQAPVAGATRVSLPLGMAPTAAVPPTVAAPAPAAAVVPSRTPSHAAAPRPHDRLSDHKGVVPDAPKRPDAPRFREAPPPARGADGDDRLCGRGGPVARHECMLDALDDADSRLRDAYDRAVGAGVDRATLVAIRGRWASLRNAARSRPAYVVGRYRELAAELGAATRDAS